jgi:ABC-type oligopeptide transport system substrate-binding subunit
MPVSVRSFSLCLVLATAILALASCESSPDAGAGTRGIDETIALRRGNGGEPQTLDPAFAEDVHAFGVLTDLYEGLVIDAGDGTLLPGAAERWDVSTDGRRYTFYLRDDAVWSNGDPLTAAHFVNGFHRVLAPGTTSAYSFFLEPILNYGPVIAGKLPPDELGVRAVDDKMLVIELDAPALYFPGILAMPIAFPLHDRDEAAKFRDPELFVGNGPYVLEQWSLGEKIRLRKNANYWNAKAAEIEFVEYFPISDPNTEYNMFRTGELDITFTVPTEYVDELRNSRSANLHIAPTLALYYLAFDLSEPPLTDVRLRQALSMAIDRQLIVEVLGRGEQPAFGLVPPGVANHVSANYEWRNLSANTRGTEARRLLTEAGFDNASPLRLLLTYDTGDVHEKIALSVKAMWEEVLGIEVDLQKKEWKYFLATREDRAAWQVMRFAWTGDYNDPGTFTDIFRSDNPQNLPAYRNAEYDRLLDNAGEAIDPEDRASIMSRAESLLLEDYPIAPLYFYVSKHLVTDRVQNFKTNVLDRHPTQFLGLDTEER